MEIDEAKKKGLCFGCGQPGHLNRDCPKKDRKFQVRRLALSDAKKAELIMQDCLRFLVTQWFRHRTLNYLVTFLLPL